MVPEPLRVALAVARIFDSLHIRYFLGGALGSAVLGEPRATEDIDIIADIRPADTDALVGAFSGAFYVPVETLRRAVERRTSFNIIHVATARKVDVFVLRQSGLDPEEMRRRLLTVIARDPEEAIYIATPEDLVLQKLEWYRKGGGVSDRQWRDVLGLLKVQAERLDREYLARWAETMGLTDLLQRAMTDAGMP